MPLTVERRSRAVVLTGKQGSAEGFEPRSCSLVGDDDSPHPSVVHLACALGRPTFTRMVDRSDTRIPRCASSGSRDRGAGAAWCRRCAKHRRGAGAGRRTRGIGRLVGRVEPCGAVGGYVLAVEEAGFSPPEAPRWARAEGRGARGCEGRERRLQHECGADDRRGRAPECRRVPTCSRRADTARAAPQCAPRAPVRPDRARASTGEIPQANSAAPRRR